MLKNAIDLLRRARTVRARRRKTAVLDPAEHPDLIDLGSSDAALVTSSVEAMRRDVARSLGVVTLVGLGQEQVVSAILASTEPGPARIAALVAGTDLPPGPAAQVAMFTGEEWDSFVAAFKADPPGYVVRVTESFRDTFPAAFLALEMDHGCLIAPDDLSGLEEQ